MVIVDKNKQYWGALTRKNGEIQRIQIMSENPIQKYKVFKGKREVTFLTNADIINIDGIGNVGTNINLWEGEYVVTFSKPEHRTEKIIIKVEEENLIVEKYLVRTHGQLNIHSSPSGANVYINNAMIGVTPLSLNSFIFGSYVVSLTKSGYYTSTFNVNFNIHPQTASATLNPIPVPPTPPYEPPKDPPSPPVIPNLPDPVTPLECNVGLYMALLNKNVSAVGVILSSDSATPDRYELFLDGKFVTMTREVRWTHVFTGLTPGRSYEFKAVVYCVNGRSKTVSIRFTVPMDR